MQLGGGGGGGGGGCHKKANNFMANLRFSYENFAILCHDSVFLFYSI